MPSLVSVVVPAYNCANYVAEAVRSALDQDYPAKEIVVVNDGSTDGTLDVLRAFGASIRIIDQKNGGPPAARNVGLREAHGEFVAFLDADDVWTPGKLSAQVAHMQARPEVGTVFSAWQEWRPAPGGIFQRPKDFAALTQDGVIDDQRSGWLYNRLLFDCELLTTTVMLRASIVEKVGEFDVELYNGDDYDYWIRASRFAQISKLRSVGALYRILPGSVARSPKPTNFEYKVVRKALDRWGAVGPDGTQTDMVALQRRLDRLELNHGYAHLHYGDPRIAFATFRDMLRRHPARAKLWLHAFQALVKLRGRPKSSPSG